MVSGSGMGGKGKHTTVTGSGAFDIGNYGVEVCRWL